MPPDEAFDSADVYPVAGSEKETWMIDFDIWFDGNPGDLTLTATAIREQDDLIKISIDDLHTL